MKAIRKPATIVFAEDDPADQLLASKAFDKAGLQSTVHLVKDGTELLEYLRGKGPYANRRRYPQAELVLLDLEMTGMDGRQALNNIKKDPALRHLPVVIMTSSSDEADVYLAYEWGAASYLTKPSDLDGWAHSLKVVADYWLGVVTTPTDIRRQPEYLQ